MKQISLAILLFLLLAHSFGSPLAQRTRSNAKTLRNSQTARQLAPYPAAGYKPEVPFTLPTDQATVEPAEVVASVTTSSLDEEDAAEDEAEAAEDLPEDVDPIAADAAEDDTELLPEPEALVSANDDEEDENADIIPEQAAGPTPSKRFWFFRK
uniref:Echinoderm microtubule-associated protein-like 4 n=1 Tax=Zeugodacus cucurbitae TaxID=28588 RepID=A0A0A1WYX9_ZEUCU